MLEPDQVDGVVDRLNYGNCEHHCKDSQILASQTIDIVEIAHQSKLIFHYIGICVYL